MTFTDVAVARGIISNDIAAGVIAFDYDGDGDLDILQINEGREEPTLPILFRNDTVSDNDWLQIKLISNGSAPNGIGAYVTVTPSRAAPSQTREMSASGTWMAQDASGILHFGFGDLPNGSTVDVQIDWPGGIQTFHAAQVLNQQITFADGLPPIGVSQGLLVVGGDGDVGPHSAGWRSDHNSRSPEKHYYFAYWSSNGGGVFADPYAAQTTGYGAERGNRRDNQVLPGVAPDADVGVARRWNKVLLQAIRKDFARPTVHARSLFPHFAAMYDAWAAFADQEDTWLLGHSRGGVDCPLPPCRRPWTWAARREAISHAAYRLLLHRFVASPGVTTTYRNANTLMTYLGYDGTDDSTDYTNGSAAALGNHIAQCYINFGLADGSNEAAEYKNRNYAPINAPLKPELPGQP